MAIGIVSDDSFEKELARLNNSTTRQSDGVITPSPTKGRSEGDNNVPESLRKIIGETAVIDSRQDALDLASQFGISPSSVSAYARGATSTASYNSPSKSLIGHINKSRQRAIKRASSTLNKALSAISQDKLDYTDAKDLASIAKDMTVVIKNLEPPAEQINSGSEATTQFVIFAPQFRDERTFESITVNE